MITIMFGSTNPLTRALPMDDEYLVLTGFGTPYGYSAAAAAPAYGTYALPSCPPFLQLGSTVQICPHLLLHSALRLGFET